MAAGGEQIRSAHAHDVSLGARMMVSVQTLSISPTDTYRTDFARFQAGS